MKINQTICKKSNQETYIKYWTIFSGQIIYSKGSFEEISDIKIKRITHTVRNNKGTQKATTITPFEP